MAAFKVSLPLIFVLKRQWKFFMWVQAHPLKATMAKEMRAILKNLFIVQSQLFWWCSLHFGTYRCCHPQNNNLNRLQNIRFALVKNTSTHQTKGLELGWKHEWDWGETTKSGFENPNGGSRLAYKERFGEKPNVLMSTIWNGCLSSYHLSILFNLPLFNNVHESSKLRNRSAVILKAGFEINRTPALSLRLRCEYRIFSWIYDQKK